MDDLELFCCAVEENEKLLKAVTEATDLDGICKIAQSYGYKITTKELEDYYMQQVSGGNFSVVDSTSYNVTINQTVGGEHNTALNFGNAGINSNLGGSDDQTINEMKKAYVGAAMTMVLGKLGQMLGQ